MNPKYFYNQIFTVVKNVPFSLKNNFSGLHEFEGQKNHEVNDFRMKMRTFCEQKAQERQTLPWQKWMEYSFPCELEPCCSPPDSGSVKSKNAKKLFINVKFEASEVSRSAVAACLSHICKGYLNKSDEAAHVKHSMFGKKQNKTVFPSC